MPELCKNCVNLFQWGLKGWGRGWFYTLGIKIIKKAEKKDKEKKKETTKVTEGKPRVKRVVSNRRKNIKTLVSLRRSIFSKQ